MTDFDILRRAYEWENDPRRPQGRRSWEGFKMGASRSDLNRLKDEGLITIIARAEGSLTASGMTKFLLTEKGKKVAVPSVLDREFERVEVSTILESLDLVVGLDDVKETMARAISAQRKINFMLEGPPACAKSLILEGIRLAVPDEYAYMAFGSRTTASGLSDVLFEYQPRLLLLDEADKFKHQDVYSVLLGLMQDGKILETKHGGIRGITLHDTAVIVACNSSAKMPREFLSRFALHIHFPPYTREEFINVCRGFLTRAEGCPEDLAVLIGQRVYDGERDPRKALGVWQLVNAPTSKEVDRVVKMKKKYGPENIIPGNNIPRKRQETGRLPGL